MLSFNANDWRVSNKPVIFSCTPRQDIDLQVSCTEVMNLWAVTSSGMKILLASGNIWRFRAQVFDYEKCILECVKPKIEFGYRPKFLARQLEEPHDPSIKAPVIEPPGPNANLLLQMRHAIRQEMQNTRQPVMEPENMTALGAHQESEDGDLMFEEEEYQAIQDEKRAAAEARKKKVAETKLKEAEKPPESSQAKPQEPQSTSEENSEGD